MKKNIVIGIDIGGSTTKIVGFDCTDGDAKLIAPLFVKATDPVTSVYGAFGRFTVENSLDLTDIGRVMMTGVGSSYIGDNIYSLPCEPIPEFRCIGLGGLYISGLKDAVVASLGTGTAFVYAKDGHEPEYLGGTGVGGGTLVGLSKKLLGMDTIEHIETLAGSGDLSHIDLKISDITKNDIIPGYGDVMTASNFGNVSDLATNSDVALGLINMVYETVAMMGIFAARSHSIKDIVLTGNLTGMGCAKTIFGSLGEMFGMNFVIPEHSRFGTVIGAALAGV